MTKAEGTKSEWKMPNVHKKNYVPMCPRLAGQATLKAWYTLCLPSETQGLPRHGVAYVPFRRGFTLVELLIVMGVIIILVSMLFPVIIGAKEKARKKQALTEAHNVVLALKGYRMEFGKWPKQTQATNDTTYFTNNYLVVRELMGQNHRGKVFLAVQALSTNISGGLTNLTGQTDNLGNFIDPWGVPYVICLDEDMSANCLINFLNVSYNNNFVSSGTKYYSATNYSVANMEVAVASFAGKTNVNPVTAAFEVETWSEPR